VRVAAPLLLAVLIAVALPASTGAGGANTLKEIVCISEIRSGHDLDCKNGKGLGNAAFLALSPDGRFVYVTGRDTDSIAAFARDPSTGRLTQLRGKAACISDSVSAKDPDCAKGNGLDRASGVAVSPDGKFVYVAANYGNSVAIFRRNKKRGALTQVGCVAEANPACAKGTGLKGAVYPAVSPDGRTLYVASGTSNAVAVFSRNVSTGALTELGCLTDAKSPDANCSKVNALDGASAVAVSADGRNVYASATRSSSVTAFARDTGTGALSPLGCISGDSGYRQDPACAAGVGLQFVQFVSVTADGKNVYVGATDSHTIAGFARDPDTGALSQLPPPDGCVKDFDNGDNPCRPGFGLSLPLAVVPSPDGKFVYTGSFGYGTVASFKRDPATGFLSQFGPCISEQDSRCDRGKGLSRAGFLALSRDGRYVYVNAPTSSAVVVFGRSQPPFPPAIAGNRGKIVKRKAVRLRLRCPAFAQAGCFGSIRLVGTGNASRLTLGRKIFDVPSGRSRKVVLGAKGPALRLLRRLKSFSAKALVVTTEPGGDVSRTSPRIRVKR
jgi:6-phosphogluconolactonase (cycloisomerase 2 family)